MKICIFGAGAIGGYMGVKLAQAGADVLVAGSAVFKGGSVSDPAPYGANIKAIREAAQGVYT